jgi:Ser/Thr protein kinase RdoA (MazF antagonist)
MKAEPRDIDRIELSRLLAVEYGLETVTLTHLAKGEDSHCYVAEVAARKKYFVRLQPARGSAASENALRIAECLSERCLLPEIVTAIRTRAGSLICSYRNYRVAAFPFIEGPTAWEIRISEPQLTAAAQVLGRLHACDSSLFPELPVEQFHNPFRQAIRVLLKSSPVGASRSIDPLGSQARALLQAEQAELLETLKRVEQLGRKLRLLGVDLVVTHGDPNLDNWILSPDGGLHLIDWGELALGPPERDLFAFAGEHFAPFIKAYTSVRKKCRLNLDVFTFYFYRWALQEVSDYGSRLLVGDFNAVEREHAWTELQKYLPIRHESIAAELNALRRDAVLSLGSAGVR